MPTTLSAATAVTNLLGRYAQCIDTGDLTAAAELFAHATLKVGVNPDGPATIDAAGVLKIWRDNIILYDDGTPRTKHVITNAIVTVDEAGDHATCHSYYTVFQQLEGFPLQPIIAGRYHDEFERHDGEWRWSFRDYSLVDLVGDLSRHLRMEVPR
jgi:hypothetical protein